MSYSKSEDKMKPVVLHSQISDEEDLENSILDQEDNNIFHVTSTGPDYRGVTLIGAAVLIAKSQFGLGVLAIPQTFLVLGFVPGLICLICLCILSTWTGLVIGNFRLAHPQVYSIGDATELMFGPIGREVMGLGFWLFYTLCYGSTLLTVSIAFNSVSDHAICTTAWVGIGAVISLILGLSVRTLKVMSWCGYIAMSTLFTSVWIVAIACLAQGRPAGAPDGPIDKMIQAVTTTSSYASISNAVATQLLSLCGSASFFTIHSEMKDQRQYTKSLLLGNGFVVFNYIVIGCIVYGKVGQYVTSPSLGSAGMLIQKITYGIAFPALFFGCFFQAHLAGKYALVRILRNSEHLQSNSKTHWITWISMMVLVICIGFVVAGSIPFFGDLLGLIGALLGTFFTLIIPGFMALFELGVGPSESGVPFLGSNWFRKVKTVLGKSKINLLTISVSIFAIIAGFYICVSGVYGSVTSISQSYADGTVGSAFSCADNSR